MSKLDIPKFVTALFSFKGKNNDELCFKKGDIITITQTDDEGWWEGTLYDKTGWFPSNYVKEYRISASPEKNSQESPVHQKLNRDIVLKDIVDSERINVAELQGLVNNFLQPLETSNILKKEEYKQLLGNIHEVLEIHQRLLSNLESSISQGSITRIGNLFLTLASRLKSIHTLYCSNHPQAVCILDRYRDELNEFMEHRGAISPGILVLTTGLSKPFRRLDKYSAMLQELERYTEKNHPDRGDTQRSIAVYREIADRCASIRKQRELALQVLTSGIKGWEGEELNTLGDILYVGSVTLASGAERRDRYFVLFPTTLLVLSTSPRMSSFIYEGKLPLTGINVVATEDTDEIRNAFEITGPMIESIIVLCTNKEERQRWIDLLIQEQGAGVLKSPTVSRVSCNIQPYTRLSRYFAKLVRKKVIHSDLMKKLLYVQYVLKPNLSNVEMRRCNVTYTIFPANSSEYHSVCNTIVDDGVVAQPQPQSKTTRKSSVTLDVRYAIEDPDLRRLRMATNTCSLTDFASRAAGHGNRSTFESSKSLPADTASSHVLPNTLLSINNLTEPTLRPRTYKYYRETLDELREHAYCDVAVRYWKPIELYPKLPEASNDSASITRDSTQSFNNRCEENAEDFQQMCPIISVGSSDSGMAESYRLHSSGTNSYYKSYGSNRDKHTDHIRTSHSESENDEHKFECQCICTSPFGSTPRDSAHSFELPQNNDTNRKISVATADVRSCDAVESKVNQVEKSVVIVPMINYGNAKERRFTEPIPYDHHINVKKLERRLPHSRQENNVKSVEQSREVYTSGLYAHWWLKKSIPLSGNTTEGKHFHSMAMKTQVNGKHQRPIMEHAASPEIETRWSLASLRPAPPLYSLKTFGKTDTSTDASRTVRTCNERQFEEDAIVLKVIEGYCLSVSARFTVHSGECNSMLDYESHKARDRLSSVHNKGGYWDSCNDRTLTETVKTLKNQMTDLQSQMSLLTKQLDEERRSRLSLAATVKRSIGVMDGSIS